MVRSFLPLKRRTGPGLVLTLHNYGMVCAKLSYIYRGAACSGPGFEKCLRCSADNYGAGRGMLFALGNWAMQRPERAAVDMFVPVSTAVAEGNALADQSLPFEVIPNFVPDDVADRWEGAEAALQRLPSGPFWLYVGALSRNKGVHVLLDAYATLVDPPPLVLIGLPWHDTPKKFPPGTTVLEGVSHPTVMAAWRRASLGIVPSVFPDPCPTVAMEAMACGVPIVASRIGGLTDLVDEGRTGFFARAGNVEDLRAVLSRIQSQPEVLFPMGQAALSKVRSFMASSVIDRIEGVYARVSNR
jgi:glycosyltransferase involved in cell wall biosynthesis